MADTRILVVEDEQPIRDLIAFGLRRAGCDVALSRVAAPPSFTGAVVGVVGAAFVAACAGSPVCCPCCATAARLAARTNSTPSTTAGHPGDRAPAVRSPVTPTF